MFQARFLLCSDLISFKKCFFLPFFSFLFFVFDSSRRSQRRQSKNDCLRNLFQSSRISSGSFLIFCPFFHVFCCYFSFSLSHSSTLYTHLISHLQVSFSCILEKTFFGVFLFILLHFRCNKMKENLNLLTLLKIIVSQHYHEILSVTQNF
jgi:hypothetical protein